MPPKVAKPLLQNIMYLVLVYDKQCFAEYGYFPSIVHEYYQHLFSFQNIIINVVGW